jgi:hypothetical protein
MPDMYPAKLFAPANRVCDPVERVARNSVYPLNASFS